MKLQHLSWPDVEDYLARTSGIVIPTGSTEQHGPDGAIGTDAICAEQVAYAAAKRHGDMLVAPCLALTPAQFNLGFPGTISVRAATFMALVCDVVESLARQGFGHIYFLNGHGANLAPIRAAFHDLHQRRRRQDPALRLRLRSWWEFDAVDAERQRLYGRREGLHATPSEISITLAAKTLTRPIAPTEDFEPLPADSLIQLGGDNHDAWFRHRQAFPSGRVGSDPGLSQEGHGMDLIDLAATAAADDYRQFVGAPDSPSISDP